MIRIIIAHICQHFAIYEKFFKNEIEAVDFQCKEEERECPKCRGEEE